MKTCRTILLAALLATCATPLAATQTGAAPHGIPQSPIHIENKLDANARAIESNRQAAEDVRSIARYNTTLLVGAILLMLVMCMLNVICLVIWKAPSRTTSTADLEALIEGKVKQALRKAGPI